MGRIAHTRGKVLNQEAGEEEGLWAGRRSGERRRRGAAGPGGSPVEVSSARKIVILNWSPPSAGGGLEITARGGAPARLLTISKDLRAVLALTGRAGGCSVGFPAGRPRFYPVRRNAVGPVPPAGDWATQTVGQGGGGATRRKQPATGVRGSN